MSSPFFSLLAILTSSSYCPQGFSTNNLAGQQQCFSCTIGKFQDSIYQATCKSCPKGSYGDENQSTNKFCKACEKGRYSSVPGGTKYSDCLFCEAGRWTNIERQISSNQCAACRAGRYGTEEGCIAEHGTAKDPTTVYNQRDGNGNWSCSHSCRGCPLGRFGTVEAASSPTSCSECPVGFYGDQEGLRSASLCKACTHGRWGGVSGLVSARSLDVPAAKRCTACPKGKFNNVLGIKSAAACKNCPQGRYLDTTNDEVPQYNVASNSCKKCPAGRWSSATGLIAQDSRWNTDPTTSNVGVSCLGCPAGKFFDQEVSCWFSSCVLLAWCCFHFFSC